MKKIELWICNRELIVRMAASPFPNGTAVISISDIGDEHTPLTNQPAGVSIVSRGVRRLLPILECRERRGIKVFADDRYYPNKLVFRRVLKSLRMLSWM